MEVQIVFIIVPPKRVSQTDGQLHVGHNVTQSCAHSVCEVPPPAAVPIVLPAACPIPPFLHAHAGPSQPVTCRCCLPARRATAGRWRIGGGASGAGNGGRAAGNSGRAGGGNGGWAAGNGGRAGGQWRAGNSGRRYGRTAVGGVTGGRRAVGIGSSDRWQNRRQDHVVGPAARGGTCGGRTPKHII